MIFQWIATAECYSKYKILQLKCMVKRDITIDSNCNLILVHNKTTG